MGKKETNTFPLQHFFLAVNEYPLRFIDVFLLRIAFGLRPPSGPASKILHQVKWQRNLVEFRRAEIPLRQPERSWNLVLSARLKDIFLRSGKQKTFGCQAEPELRVKSSRNI
jgi:hypothetical protein